MSTKEHYNNHLGNFYSWMLGNWIEKTDEFYNFLKENSLVPGKNALAIDLGAGNGLQTIALAKLGYSVTAIDFNPQLLDELKKNTSEFEVKVIEADIREYDKYINSKPSLIVCCGDTISHLESKEEIRKLIIQFHESLDLSGKIILSFRDYSNTLEGDSRFIPVKSEETQIHTCILDYEIDRVRVTDQLYQKINSNWVMKISSYFKVRLIESEILSFVKDGGFKVILQKKFQNMIIVVAERE
ncbi:MAG: class I SAM-dependent methyltransferase [Nanoarchaeota archaeon]